jgi:hypothetical protein
VLNSDFNAGSTPPIYLWTAFFKIDADNVKVDQNFKLLQGSATVVGTPGNIGDLPNGDSDFTSDWISVPTSLGDFRTVLVPIPVVDFPGVTLPGVVGSVAVLLAHNFTSDDAAVQGHNALNSSLQQQLNDLISNVSIHDETVTDADVQNMKTQISSAVKSAVTDAL